MLSSYLPLDGITAIKFNIITYYGISLNSEDVAFTIVELCLAEVDILGALLGQESLDLHDPYVYIYAAAFSILNHNISHITYT